MSGSKPTAFENLVIWLIIPILSTVNQLVQKSMALSLPHAEGLAWLKQITINPWLLAVLLCEVTTFVLWLGVLKNVNLSRATPITSIAYLLIVFVGWLFFGEAVHIVQIIGVLLIIGGLQLLSPDGAS
jgi:drug/metabolite transporter (DMT)-like permease